MVVANPAVSQTTGWPIGFWAAELIHPSCEFTAKGHQVEIASPQGRKLRIDSFGDPRDASGYSAHDLISMVFSKTPQLAALPDETRSIAAVKIADYDALFLAGGQSPMHTFINATNLLRFVADFYEAGKLVAIVCHGTRVLLKASPSLSNCCNHPDKQRQIVGEISYSSCLQLFCFRGKSVRLVHYPNVTNFLRGQ